MWEIWSESTTESPELARLCNNNSACRGQHLDTEVLLTARRRRPARVWVLPFVYGLATFLLVITLAVALFTCQKQRRRYQLRADLHGNRARMQTQANA